MNKDLYSNIEFSKLVERINREVNRRGTFRWWDPFVSPMVGQDRTNAISLPTNGIRVEVTNKTYTINNPSKGSMEETRNIEYEKQGFNPAGQKPDKNKSFPNTSASRFDVDEIKNMLIGLSKIRDISLFYGRDEQEFLAFRDHKGIDNLVKEASKDKLNVPLHESPNKHTKIDPNNGITNKRNKDYPNSFLEVEFPKENDQYVMPSGEYDGEECLTVDGPNEKNFYDDYGAKPGEINHKSLNPYISPVVDRSWHDQDDDRNEIYKEVKPGGRSSNRFGETPRNPQKGDPYPSRPVYGGAETTCNNACSGVCFKAGTLIETIHGPIPIEEIRIGDMVLTQSGKYHRVYDTFRRNPDPNNLIILQAVGAPKIYTTKEHPFWARRFIGRKYINHKYPQVYSSPEWIKAEDLNPRDKVCLLNKECGKTHVPFGVAYMVGRWLGDGWRTIEIDPNNGAIYKRFSICCGKHEQISMEEKLEICKIKYSRRELQTSISYRIPRSYVGANKELGKEYNNVELLRIISKCGNGAAGKYLAQEIFQWDKESITALLEGYIDADGHKTDYISSVTSISKKLIYGISLLMRMIGIIPSWSVPNKVNHVAYIEGRKVHIHDTFILGFSFDEFTRNYSFYDDSGLIWTTVRTPIKVKEGYEVYNISVEEDPTYYADGLLVHNCSFTCDNECSESCSTTCTFRCGNNCTSTCGNVCTGCTTLCYTSCSSKCEQNVGYSCLKAGAKAVHITTSGGRDGIPAKNEITSEIHTCTACSFTCQFYPNKKTECWDSACMGMCFTSCMHSCSSSCFGGCIDNENQNKGDFKTGIGRGCSSGCTANCIGICRGTCVGNCISSCFHGCQSSCFDNCMRTCSTSCGSGCQSGCTAYCVNRCTSCTGTCSGIASALQTYCSDNGCTMNCMQGCNKNCVGIGCKSICGTESAGACEANCRLSCMNASCTAMCSDQCASYCTSCVNGCNFQCGACSSLCSTGCESACNINCTKECQHSCSINCLNSCKDDCGGCSSLCYSCVGMCIGVCSVKCQAGCSSCANNCSWWCDTSCNQACFSNCSNQCISTCSGSCATFLTSETTTYLDLPERPPTAEGYKYPHPKNRWEQRESFKLVHDEEYFEEKPVEPGEDPFIPKEQETRILITINKEKNMDVICKDGELDWEVKYATLHGGVFDINQDTGEILINEDAARNLMKQLHFENTDKKQSILAVIIHPKEDYEFTKKDVSHKLPFGYISINSVFLENGDFVSIIQRLRNYL